MGKIGYKQLKCATARPQRRKPDDEQHARRRDGTSRLVQPRSRSCTDLATARDLAGHHGLCGASPIQPALRQIGEAAELASTSSVSYQLSELAAHGIPAAHPGRPRSIELRVPGSPRPAWRRGPGGRGRPPDPDPASIPVPFYGQIAAGPKPDRADHRGNLDHPRGHLGSAQGTRRRRDAVPSPRPRRLHDQCRDRRR